jgi:DNA-binding MarR family transcriptional regulator
MKQGSVELMIEHWSRERPELDTSSLGVLARVSRLAKVAQENAEAVLRQFGLSEVEFLLLAAIRMTPDQHPSPRDLLGSLMVTSGGLTNRIDRLSALGLVARIANPGDRRGILLELTDSGRELVDRVTTAYVENQNKVLDTALDKGERDTLATLLRKLLSWLVEDADGKKAGSIPGRSWAPSAPNETSTDASVLKSSARS